MKRETKGTHNPEQGMMPALSLDPVAAMEQTYTQLTTGRRLAKTILMLASCIAISGVVAFAVLGMGRSIRVPGRIALLSRLPLVTRVGGQLSLVVRDPMSYVEEGTVLGRVEPAGGLQLVALADERANLAKLESQSEMLAANEAFAQQALLLDRANLDLSSAKARLRAGLVERGLPPDVDSVLRQYSVGTSVDLDLLVADVRRAALDVARQSKSEVADAILSNAQQRRRAREALANLEAASAVGEVESRQIVAPRAGFFQRADLDTLSGRTVAAGFEIGRIVDTAAVFLVVEVSAKNAMLVESGDIANVRLTLPSADPDIEFKSRVVRLTVRETNRDGLTNLQGFIELPPEIKLAALHNPAFLVSTFEVSIVSSRTKVWAAVPSQLRKVFK